MLQTQVSLPVELDSIKDIKAFSFSGSETNSMRESAIWFDQQDEGSLGCSSILKAVPESIICSL